MNDDDMSPEMNTETGPAAEGGANALPPATIPELADAAGLQGQSMKRGNAVMGVPIEVVISVGRARPLISELIELRRDSVLALDSKIEDPVEVFVGEKLIARGELQELDDGTGRLGVRLTEVADLSQAF